MKVRPLQRRRPRGPARRWRWPAGVLVWPALFVVSLVPGVLPALLAPLSGGEPSLPGEPLWRLALTHLQLVFLAELMVIALGVPLVVFVTRARNRAFLGLTEALVGLGQTVPTLAILALAVPVLGFGVAPTLLGLVLYGLVPVVSNGVAGLLGVNAAVLDAATGMGMTGAQRFWRVELPLALPVWLAGLRTSTVFNVAVATVGAALGAGGLGLPIILGLSQQDTGLVFLGALPAALLALSLDALLGVLVARSERRLGNGTAGTA